MNLKAQEALWQHGPRKIATELALTDGAIYAWISGKSKPRYETAQKVVEIVNKDLPKAKRITFDDLMAPHEESPIKDRRSTPNTSNKGTAK